MDHHDDEDILDGVDRELRSSDGLMVVVLVMVAIGGIVVTLVSALIAVLS